MTIKLSAVLLPLGRDSGLIMIVDNVEAHATFPGHSLNASIPISMPHESDVQVAVLLPQRRHSFHGPQHPRVAHIIHGSHNGSWIHWHVRPIDEEGHDYGNHHEAQDRYTKIGADVLCHVRLDSAEGHVRKRDRQTQLGKHSREGQEAKVEMALPER